MIGDPERPLRGAQPARRRDARRQRRRHQGPDRPDRRPLDGPTAARWSTTGTGPRDLRLLDFLRDVGKHVTVNQMVARESVKARMASEHGISFTEFSYMLLQANDYLLAPRPQGCRAADRRLRPVGQHRSAGVDLIRRVDRRPRSTPWPGRCSPPPDGTKLGKTTGARVWLDPDRTSPYQFFQHWMQHRRPAGPRSSWPSSRCCRSTEIDELVAAHEADARSAGRPSGRWPGRSPRWSTAPRRPAAAEAAARRSCSAARSTRRRRRGARGGRPARCRGRRDRRGRAGGRHRRGRGPAPRAGAGRLDGRGPPDRRPGRRLRQRGAGRRGPPPRPRPTCSTAGAVLLRKGKKAHGLIAVARSERPP